ncbi:hypothetical protein H8959_001895 [Pygathrix nigripes]
MPATALCSACSGIGHAMSSFHVGHQCLDEENAVTPQNSEMLAIVEPQGVLQLLLRKSQGLSLQEKSQLFTLVAHCMFDSGVGNISTCLVFATENVKVAGRASSIQGENMVEKQLWYAYLDAQGTLTSCDEEGAVLGNKASVSSLIMALVMKGKNEESCFQNSAALSSGEVKQVTQQEKMATVWDEAEQDGIGEEVLKMSTGEIISRTQILDSEIKIMKSEVLRVTHELQAMKDKIKENSEKIRVNKTLLYLVCNIIKLLDVDSNDQEEDGAHIDLDPQRKGKCAVIKTSRRQTYFLPVIGLVMLKS